MKIRVIFPQYSPKWQVTNDTEFIKVESFCPVCTVLVTSRSFLHSEKEPKDDAERAATEERGHAAARADLDAYMRHLETHAEAIDPN